MRQRLQINMKGEDLKRGIGEAIATWGSELTALEGRIKARDGDRPFDVRADDGFASLEELETKRTQICDRVTQLELLRDSVISSDEHALSKSDCVRRESPRRSRSTRRSAWRAIGWSVAPACLWMA